MYLRWYTWENYSMLGKYPCKSALIHNKTETKRYLRNLKSAGRSWHCFKKCTSPASHKGLQLCMWTVTSVPKHLFYIFFPLVWDPRWDARNFQQKVYFTGGSSLRRMILSFKLKPHQGCPFHLVGTSREYGDLLWFWLQIFPVSMSREGRIDY